MVAVGREGKDKVGHERYMLVLDWIFLIAVVTAVVLCDQGD